MLTEKNKNVVLVQGVIKETLLDRFKKRKIKEVFVLEGRPKLEAAQRISRELLRRRMVPVLISDNMAGFLFYKKMIKEVWLAYQLKDQSGALCDIGALILGVLGKKHRVPVHLYPSARKTPFLGTPSDLVHFMKKRVAPEGVKGYVPLVEWLPKKYITKIHSNGQ